MFACDFTQLSVGTSSVGLLPLGHCPPEAGSALSLSSLAGFLSVEQSWDPGFS